MYNLESLGWYGFQQLCNSIAREIMGQTAMSYLPSKDGGRDGSFSGKWINTDKETLTGQFVIQCKFTAVKNYHLKPSDIKDDIVKAKSLVKKGLCDIYVLMTNAGLSGRTSENIETALKKIGVQHVKIFGSTWINDQIKEHSRLRRMVPRVYGLGDLSQILDERVHTQGKALLESLKDELAKVVVTSTYYKAAEALQEHGFVLIVGEPAAGKTTIASLLAMGALDQWKALTLKLNSAEQVLAHWNADDPGQFFWIDDAFGPMQYESNLARRWNHSFPEIKAMLKNGAKIVMTSRDYIYNRARKDLKTSAFPLLNESQVVIDVHNLSPSEKRQILYNHLKLGNQPKEFITAIKCHLEYIASLERFIPETARRLAEPIFTKDLYISEYYLEKFVNNQETFLVDILRGLDRDNLAALALIYMNNGNLKSPIRLSPFEDTAINRLGSSLNGCISALESLRGNLVQFIGYEDEFFWKFKHPTIGDAFAVFVLENTEMLEIYLHGSSVDKLLDQITCGDVGLAKAVIIPKSFFSLILNKLNGFKKTATYKTGYLATWGAKRELHDFLSSRCSIEFLTIYVAENPEILEQACSPGLNLDTVSEVDLAVTLYEAGLFAESYRKRFVNTVSEYAITGQDLYALSSEKIKQMFLEDEVADLRKKIVSELVPKLPTLKRKWETEYTEGEDAEFHMDSLMQNLKILEEQFAEVPQLSIKIEAERSLIKDWIEEASADSPEIPKRKRLSGLETSDSEYGERSIFEDIDS